MKPVSMPFETGFIVLFIGTLGALTEQNKGFCVQYSPFFRLFIAKNGNEAYLIMGRMLLKLRPDVAVTASGRSCCYVVT
jgi:hypothetical protein